MVRTVHVLVDTLVDAVEVEEEEEERLSDIELELLVAGCEVEDIAEERVELLAGMELEDIKALLDTELDIVRACEVDVEGLIRTEPDAVCGTELVVREFEAVDETELLEIVEFKLLDVGRREEDVDEEKAELLAGIELDEVELPLGSEL